MEILFIIKYRKEHLNMLSKSLFSLIWKVRLVKITLLFELFITQILSVC